MTAATFPFSPLQQLYAKLPDLLNTSNTLTTYGAQLVSLGNKYYISVDTMKCSMNAGLSWKLVLLMPEDDITGAVVKGRNIAIGTMCGVCVFLVIAAVVFIAFVLRPLQRVSDRMYLAADLNDTEEDDALSVLTEIALLQDSYKNLRAKLNEMKAFVPQALLHGNDDAEDVDVVDVENASHHSSNKLSSPQKSTDEVVSASRLEESEMSRFSQNSGRGVHGIKVASSLTKRSISVLQINVRHFEPSLNPLSAAEGLQLCDRLYHDVCSEMREQKGVIASFHGDHFLVTFNAASPAASPSKRAAIAALKVRDALKSLRCQTTCGISSGTALCGNAGCSELKGFSCVGRVVVQAVVLERLAKLFSERYGDSVCILATGACATDIQYDVLFQIVDFVAIPRPELLLQIVSLKHAKDDEWMYQLHQGESLDPFATVNAAFHSLHRGDVEKARALFAQRPPSTATAPAPDAVGAAQLEVKLAHSGEKMTVVDPSWHHATDQDHNMVPLSDFGAFFSCHF